jgi:hypothetical protein
MTNRETLRSLAERVATLTKPDNAVDALVEVALFKPDEHYVNCRPNAAGTKVIYTNFAGRDETCWAREWTAIRRQHLAASLRAIGEGL